MVPPPKNTWIILLSFSLKSRIIQVSTLLFLLQVVYIYFKIRVSGLIIKSGGETYE